MSERGAGERYELREGPLFLSSVYRLIGSVPEWDDMRVVIDQALTEDPSNPEIAWELGLNLWFTEFEMPPGLALLYEVRESERVVVYEAIVAPL